MDNGESTPQGINKEKRCQLCYCGKAENHRGKHIGKVGNKDDICKSGCGEPIHIGKCQTKDSDKQKSEDNLAQKEEMKEGGSCQQEE